MPPELPPAETHEVCWWQAPTADALQPVGPRLLAEHRALMVEMSTGRGASPLYRETWSEIGIQLTLQSYNQPFLPLTPDEAERAKQLAFASASTAANALALTLVDQSVVLSTLDRGRRTLTSPTLERHEHGLTLVPGSPRSARRPNLEEARVLEPGRGNNRVPRVGLVNGLALRPLDDLEDATFDLVWNTAFIAQNTAIDNLRISAELSGLDPRDDRATALTWSAAAQEQLVPGWFLQTEARSEPDSPAPLQVRAGLGYQLWPADPRWMLRGSMTWGLSPDAGADPLRRAELRLQWNGPWMVPMPAEPPRPGDRPEGPSAWPRSYYSAGNTVSWKATPPLDEDPVSR